MPMVAAAAVLAMQQQSKQRQQQQHDNNTSTNTTTNKTVNTEGEYVIEWRERNCVQNCVFSGVSRYVLTPGQCYARQTSEGHIFLAGKVCFCVFG
jgi:hypothetical protein